MGMYTCKFKHTTDKYNVNYVTQYLECARQHCNALIVKVVEEQYVLAGREGRIREIASDLATYRATNDSLTCLFCKLKYIDFPLDVLVSDTVWKKIRGREDGSGVMCVACIVNKTVEAFPEVTVGRLEFDIKE